MTTDHKLGKQLDELRRMIYSMKTEGNKTYFELKKVNLVQGIDFIREHRFGLRSRLRCGKATSPASYAIDETTGVKGPRPILPLPCTKGIGAWSRYGC